MSLERKGMFRSLSLALLVIVLGAVSSLAQTGTGIVLGTVTDPTGAVLVGAEVTLSNVAQNIVRTEKTNESGQYIFVNVTPGNYSISVKISGFRTAQVPELKVEVTKSHTVNFAMQLGDISSTVEVSAEAGAELQTTDATVGNVIPGNVMPRFPTFTRRANELLTLQPGVEPGGSVTGARNDQSTFTLDGIDVTNQSVGGLTTYMQLPIDGIEEFRVGISNPTAMYGRGAGGQVNIVSKSGNTDLHGSVFWYHQNDNLNAHTWTDKRLGNLPSGAPRVKEPETKDNRFGFAVGGPIWPWTEKAFFFLNYDGRRFPRNTPFNRIVPTSTLRQGILQFRDSTNNVVAYNLATSTLCGSGGNLPCDPRGLGLSPTIAALWSNLPAGNDSSRGDGLNTEGFVGNVSNPINNDYYNARVDYNLTSTWRMDVAFRYFREKAEGAGLLDIIGGNVQSRETFPARQNMVSAGIRGQISPTLSGDFRFGWVRVRTATERFRPDASAALLNLAGTSTGLSSGQSHVALDIGARGGAQSILSEPIDVDTQLARKQANDNRVFQYNADMNWVKGTHTFQFGTHIRYLPTLHLRDDKVLGALGALVAQIDANLGGITIPTDNAPPTCGGAITTNCLRSTEVSTWGRIYAGVLGLIDNVSVLAVRDGQFNPLPFGETLEADTKLWAPEFYVQDVWRLNPSLTVTLGLNYGWQKPPSERLNRQSVQIDGGTGEDQTSNSYFEARRIAALQGVIFNPAIAFMPIESHPNRSAVFDTDWNNIGPRVAAAWSPSSGKGLFGWLFGENKTVIRAGYSLIYDRQNTVQSVIIPTLGVAFAQTINITGPLCNATGAGGTGCTPAGGNIGLNGFRVGVDGQIPLPTVPAQAVPVAPFWGPPVGGTPPFAATQIVRFPEVLSFQVDPNIEVGENHAFDLTWQRELPHNMILEVGYVGRYAKKLPQSMNFGQSPYMFVDPASGQSFAEAFDAVALQVRAGTLAQNVTIQPWFENHIPAFFGTTRFCELVINGVLQPVPCTQWLAGTQGANISNGNISSIFSAVDLVRMRAALTPFNNYVSQMIFLRSSTGSSNYNAALITLRKRTSRGLTYTLNYTWSKSLDQLGAIQNAASVMPNSFDLDAEYGPSSFDINHLLNATWLYELPFGRGSASSFGRSAVNKVLGGWYFSGIFTSSSGVPLTVTQGSQVWGGSLFLGFNSGAIPTVDPSTFGNSPHFGSFGSGGIGTNASPTTGGSGYNLFENPQAVYNTLRRIELSRDGRSGRANPFRGMPRWNLDVSLGKRTSVTEHASVVFSADFFNVTNSVVFADPGLTLAGQTSFGVITSQFVPANRTVGSRWIQLGLRVEF